MEAQKARLGAEGLRECEARLEKAVEENEVQPGLNSRGS